MVNPNPLTRRHNGITLDYKPKALKYRRYANLHIALDMIPFVCSRDP